MLGYFFYPKLGGLCVLEEIKKIQGDFLLAYVHGTELQKMQENTQINQLGDLHEIYFKKMSELSLVYRSYESSELETVFRITKPGPYFLVLVSKDLSIPTEVEVKFTQFYFTASPTGLSPNPTVKELTDKKAELLKISSFLSFERRTEPYYKLLFFFVFLLMLYSWASYCWRNKLYANRVHLVLGVLLVSKTLLQFCEFFSLTHFAAKGKHDFTTSLYLFVLGLKSAVFLAAVLLLGSGWVYLRPFLGKQEKRAISLVLALQIAASVFFALSKKEDTNFSTELGAEAFSFLIELFCFIYSFSVILATIKELENAVGVKEKEKFNLLKLKQFQRFYKIVMVFYYSSNIFMWVLSAILPIFLTWFRFLLQGLIESTLYGLMLLMFRPKRVMLEFTKVKGLNIEDVSLDEEACENESFDSEKKLKV